MIENFEYNLDEIWDMAVTRYEDERTADLVLDGCKLSAFEIYLVTVAKDTRSCIEVYDAYKKRFGFVVGQRGSNLIYFDKDKFLELLGENVESDDDYANGKFRTFINDVLDENKYLEYKTSQYCDFVFITDKLYCALFG